MELNTEMNDMKPWGITPFDDTYGGLPTPAFNLLRTYNKGIAIAAMGSFLNAGLVMGQRVTLVGFDQAMFVMRRFKDYGFNFEEALSSERLIYLYYKPSLSYALNFATDYRQLLHEARVLAKGSCDRIGFLNADVLFNLETYLLAEASAEKLAASFARRDCTVLGCYQALNTPAHQYLHDVSRSILSCYIEIQPSSRENNRRYELIVHKFPLFDTKQPLDLMLAPDSGFVSANVELIKYG